MVSKQELKALQREREAEISKLLLQQPVDLVALRAISRLKGGFLTSRLRTRVWPKLLGINRYDLEDYRKYVSTVPKSPKRAEHNRNELSEADKASDDIQDKQDQSHRDSHQVSCDVDRSLHNIYQIKFWSEAYRSTRRKVLSDIILAVLCKHPDRYYYQGFHDVVSVFFLVVEDDHLAFALTDAVCSTYFADYMTKNFENVSRFMQILMVLLKFTDSTLCNYLCAARVEPFFAISWIITWFAHDIKSIDSVARIFDVMLSSHPMYCYYLCAAYVLCLKKDLLNCECDFSTLHNFLIKSPARNGGLPFEKMVKIADELMLRIPLSKLVANASSDIKMLVKQKRVSLMSSTALMDDDFVDSDLTILENLRGRRAPTYPIFAFYWKQLCSWTTRTMSSVNNRAELIKDDDKIEESSDDVEGTITNQKRRRSVIIMGTVVAAASVAVSVALIFDEKNATNSYIYFLSQSLQRLNLIN